MTGAVLDGAQSSTVRLAVIIPTYNVVRYVSTCLESVLRDADHRVDVIVVDDASTDGTRDVLDRFARHHDQVRVIGLDSNAGQGPARNRGAQEADADYLWFLDADDWLAPGGLARVLDVLSAHRPDLVLTDYAWEFPDGQTLPCRTRDFLQTENALVSLDEQPQLCGISYMPGNKIVRTDLWADHGLHFARGWYEDIPVFAPALMLAESIFVLDELVLHYRRHPAQSTQTESAKHLAAVDRWNDALTFAAAQGRPDVQAWLYRYAFTQLMSYFKPGNSFVPQDRLADLFSALHRFRATWRPASREIPLRTMRHRVASGLVGLNSYRLFRAHTALETRLERLRR